MFISDSGVSGVVQFFEQNSKYEVHFYRIGKS